MKYLMCRLFPLSSHRLLLLLRVSKHRQTLKVIVDNTYLHTNNYDLSSFTDLDVESTSRYIKHYNIDIDTADI